MMAARYYHVWPEDLKAFLQFISKLQTEAGIFYNVSTVKDKNGKITVKVG